MASDLLFQEEDFELEHFDDAEFVAKYRKVITLESLREQLVEYSGNVRNELYAIINRDYKDFITISTKLDGLETRLELIQKPLFDLQMNVSSLHNCVTSSLRSIKDKISHQAHISEQKNKIKQLIDAIDNLRVVQEAMSSHGGGGDVESSRSMRSQFYRDGLLPSLSHENHAELFSCSEYERMAAALAVTLHSLESIDSGKGVVDVGVLINLTDLQDEAAALKKLLEEKMTSHIETAFMNAFKSQRSEDTSASSSLTQGGFRLFSTEMRSFLHCVRGLKFLKAHRTVEHLFVHTVTEPYFKANLTHGKIDGKEGRGSFSGLADSLTSLVQLLRKTKLVDIFDALEDASLVTVDVDVAESDVDLIVNGLWRPLAQLFIERFAAMFSIGIPAIFSRCFLSFDQFLASLSSHLVSATYSASVLHRLQSDDVTTAFLQMWKLDTYSQLLFRESCQRLDKVCDCSLRSKNGVPSAGPSLRAVVDQLYAVVTKRGGGGGVSASLPLDPSEVDCVSDVIHGFSTQNHRLFNEYVIAFVCELSIVGNKSVMLRPLYGRFLLLIDRVVKRLLLHLSVVLVSEVTTAFCQSTFNLSKADVDSLRSMQLGGGVTSSQGAVAVTSSTIDEQILTASDVLSFVQWFLTAFPAYVTSKSLLSSQWVEGMGLGSEVREAWEELVRKSVLTSAKSLVVFLQLTYKQIVSDVTQECVKSLSNVKAIAGKYRMTNKPAPTEPSPYVAGIFAPFKKLLDSYGASLVLLSSRLGTSVLTSEDGDVTRQELGLFDSVEEEGKMKIHIIEAVTHAFHDQVLSLLATVKQMDSALQRRAIKPRTALSESASSSSSTTALSDSDKISLQLKLDVERYGAEIAQLGIDCAKVSAYQRLQAEIQNTDLNK